MVRIIYKKESAGSDDGATFISFCPAFTLSSALSLSTVSTSVSPLFSRLSDSDLEALDILGSGDPDAARLGPVALVRPGAREMGRQTGQEGVELREGGGWVHAQHARRFDL